MNQKVGFAKDIHRLYKKKNRKLILGGYTIEDAKYKIKAHSDGDIIIHSLCSSLLSILNQPTLGELYPENQDNKDLDSTIMLLAILDKLNKTNIKVSSIDITIVCEKIIIKPYIKEITRSLKAFFKSNVAINVKATRFENKYNKFIECYTIVLIH